MGVVGDLRDAEAHRFTQETMVRMRRRQGQETLLIEEEEWARVYEVCGGNPQLLTRGLHLWGDALLEGEEGVEGGDRLTALESGTGEQGSHCPVVYAMQGRLVFTASVVFCVFC